jgi:secondary thiamine-phosphate synthase enzyme
MTRLSVSSRDREAMIDITRRVADAHVKSVLVGQSVSIPVSGGALALGTWQGVFLCEFDGPRTREVLVTVR